MSFGVGVDIYGMLCSPLFYKQCYLLPESADVGTLVVKPDNVVGIDSELQHVGSAHLSSLAVVVLLVGRWQFAHESVVHIHRCGHKEECEQHKRYVGCCRGVELRHGMFFALYEHILKFG